MTDTEPVTVDIQAVTVFNSVPESDRAEALRVLEGLIALPPDRWPSPQVQRLATPRPLYLLNGTNNLLVVFRRESDGRVTILDAFSRAALLWFSSLESQPRPVA